MHEGEIKRKRNTKGSPVLFMIESLIWRAATATPLALDN